MFFRARKFCQFRNQFDHLIQQNEHFLRKKIRKLTDTTQYSQYEVHQRTESPSQGRDQHAQVFRKSVFFYPQIVVVTLSTFMC